MSARFLDLASMELIHLEKIAAIEAEERAIRELAQRLQLAQDDLTQQENAFEEERSTLCSESPRLKRELESSGTVLAAEQERSARLERELQQVRAQLESEALTRRILEDRNGELSADTALQRKEIARALSNATEQAREAEMLRQEHARVREEFEEVKLFEQRNADKVVQLLVEQSNNLKFLEEARARGEDLELQIHMLLTTITVSGGCHMVYASHFPLLQ